MDELTPDTMRSRCRDRHVNGLLHRDDIEIYDRYADAWAADKARLEAAERVTKAANGVRMAFWLWVPRTENTIAPTEQTNALEALFAALAAQDGGQAREG